MTLWATVCLAVVGAAVLAGPWAKLDQPIQTLDGRTFGYEFFDNRSTTGGGVAQTDAIKGYVTSVTYG